MKNILLFATSYRELDPQWGIKSSAQFTIAIKIQTVTEFKIDSGY